MTEIGTELMPTMGSKINLAMCPGPASLPIYNDSYYYHNCAWYMNVQDKMVSEGLAIIENRSSDSRIVMIDDLAVLVPSAMPDNIDNLTFSSFGLITHCQPTVDCSDHSESTGTIIYCPFSPPYNITNLKMAALDSGQIDMFNLTNYALSPDPDGGYPLDSVLNPIWSTCHLVLVSQGDRN